MLDNVFKERGEEGNVDAPPPSSPRVSPLPAALLLPLLILLLLGLIVYLFGWLSFDPRGAQELVEEIRASSGERRSLTAFELSRLESYDLSGAQRRQFLEEVEGLLKDGEGGDSRVRRALVIVLGRTADSSSVPALIEAAEDPDPETQIYALWALGAIGDARALDSLTSHLHHDDPAIRKTAAFALGEMGDSRAVAPLEVLLQDPVSDVTWNAAVALARLGDEAAVPTLLPLLSGSISGATLSPSQREDLRLNVIRSLKRLKAEAVRESLRQVASSDPSARVRSEARLALEGRSPPPFGPLRDLASPR